MEKELIQKAARVSEAAFEALVTAHQAQVYRLCWRITGNREDAADMTQETFVKVWKHLPDFRFDCDFSTWLYQVASRSCLDLLRSKSRRPTVSAQEDRQDAADPAPTPEAALISQESRRELQLALQQLEPEQRALLSLRVAQGCSYQEISKILRIPEGTVKSRLARAREGLRKKLSQLGNQSASPASKSVKGGRGV